jgi:pyruvate formate lyase activating enzyme
MSELNNVFAGREARRVCAICERSFPLISEALGVCPVCARAVGGLAHAREAHERSRRRFALSDLPPRARDGVKCGQCAAECCIGEGERSYCGMKTVEEGHLVHLAGTPERGVLRWYRDPLPTNCVADWVCPGRDQAGMHNLAVCYLSCTLDCLFCQNWQFRDLDPRRSTGTSAEHLAAQANARTFCACFFGGDPASQMGHALASAELLAERGLRICWETAGTSSPDLLERAALFSLETGGCVKFDLKAFTDPLHVALTGSSNRRTLSNFARMTELCAERSNGPLLVASTVLVPGYVDAREVKRIARFIAEWDPETPYSLLAFAPAYLMSDLPPTSAAHAKEALQAARDAGLKNVRIGNEHLLGAEYPTAAAGVE